MKRKITILFFLLFLPTFVLAGTVGKIQGKVTDLQTGEALIGANVLVVGTSFGAATDVNGEFVINNLDPGVYQLKCSYLGYKTVTVSNVRVQADLTTEQEFKLPAEGVSVGEVTIVAQRPLINKSNTNAIRSTTGKDIEALPVRGINNVLQLTPGVVLSDGNVFVRGGRVDEVGYYLEGTNITNPVFGGRGITIIQDAVEEIQVQAGGYTAEFGGANAGIIRTQLKSGTPDFKFTAEYYTDNLSFKSKSSRFDGKKTLGAYTYGENEFIGTVSGPLFAKNIKFFGLFDSHWQLDPNPRPFPGFDLGVITDPNSSTPGHESINMYYPGGPTYATAMQSYTGTGTLTLDFNPLIFRVTGSLTWRDYGRGGGGNISQLLNMGRISHGTDYNFAGTFKMTHILSPTTYYEVNFGYTRTQSVNYDPLLKYSWKSYGDSVANANAGAVWTRTAQDIEVGRTGRYQRPTGYDILGFYFNAPGDITAGFGRTKREEYNFAASFSTEINKVHSIKFGGEFQTYTLRSYGVTARSYANAVANMKPGDDIRDIMIGLTNSYGYDFFGNEVNTDFNPNGGVFDPGLLAPKRPKFAGVYIQDKIEYKNLIINVGLRYDYIDIDNLALKDPTRPETAFNIQTFHVDSKGLTKTPSYSGISPRLGFSFPVTDQTVFHAQYGKFVQQSKLRDTYQGIYQIASVNLNNQYFVGAPVGWNIRPTRTTQYEIGFTQQLSNFASFDITGYYKDIQDQVEFGTQEVGTGSAFKSYNILQNGDFATTKGVELSFNMRRIDRIQVNGSVSFQNAQGTGSNANSHAGIVGAPLDGVTVFNPAYVSPLDFNKAISGNFNVDYRFSKDEESSVLRQLGLSMLFRFDSGHPYTLGIGKGNNSGSLEGDARFRAPIEPLNASTTPWTYNIDLRIDKSFPIMDKLKANVYVWVTNLLDTRNIENVFLRTGSATDDGYLSDPTLGGSLHPDQRADYVAMYKAINLDYYQGFQAATGNYLYSAPRQIRFGIRLEY